MTPIDWALRPLKKYAQFSGRAPRAEYWWFMLANTAIAFVVVYVEEALGLVGETGLSAYGAISAIYTLALLIPSFSVTVRRLHDTDRVGQWIVLGAMPYILIVAALVAVGSETENMAVLGSLGLFAILTAICSIVLLVFMVQPGTRGSNNYGPDPYGEHEDLEAVFS